MTNRDATFHENRLGAELSAALGGFLLRERCRFVHRTRNERQAYELDGSRHRGIERSRRRALGSTTDAG